MKAFEEIKRLFSEKIRNRIDKHVQFIADGNGFLFKNRHFDECKIVEEWSQEKLFTSSYLCSYPKQLCDAFPYDMHSKDAIIKIHDITIKTSSERLLQEKSTKNDRLNNTPDHQSSSARTIHGYNIYNTKIDHEG